MSKIHVTTTVNGDPVEFLADPRETLLDALRNQLDLTGTKEGCGTGDCGACSVTVDGTLVCSCLMLAAEANGKRVETIEGMAKRRAAPACSASSSNTRPCSAAICTPGILVAAKALLGAEPGPDRYRGAVLAGGEPVPLHGVRQDHPRRAGRGGGDAAGTSGGCVMARDDVKTGYKY